MKFRTQNPIPLSLSEFRFLQVISLLPPYEGKTVVELGAGIGRFTAELAQRAAQVLAVDFIEDVTRKVIFQMQPSSFGISSSFVLSCFTFSE